MCKLFYILTLVSLISSLILVGKDYIYYWKNKLINFYLMGRVSISSLASFVIFITFNYMSTYIINYEKKLSWFKK